MPSERDATSPRGRLLEAAVLLAAYKHDPHPVSLPDVQETIRNFTTDDLAHVERIAARLEADDLAT